MTRMTGYLQGAPCWVNYGAMDVEASKTFYSAVLGWHYEEQETEGNRWSMARTGDAAVATLYTLAPQQTQQSAWELYLATDDVDRVTAAVRGLGGKVLMQPFSIGDYGRMSMFADPTGAVIELWQPDQHKGADAIREHGALSWAELQTSDPSEALRFYTSLLGLDSQRVPLPDGNEYILLVHDGELWAGITQVAEGTAPFWQVYFHVDDATAAVEAAQAHGATIVMQPTYEDDVGTITVLVDPQGAVFGLNTPPG